MDQNKLATLQTTFQTEAKKMQGYHDKMSQLRIPAAKLMAQLNENEMVKKELDLLDDDNGVYKLMGSVMVKQELIDVRSNVDNRLKYIHAELARFDKEIKECQDAAENSQKIIAEISHQFKKMQDDAKAVAKK